MTAENIEMVSMCMQNHLSAWIMAHGDSISKAGADRVYRELKEKRLESFTLESALEDFENK